MTFLRLPPHVTDVIWIQTAFLGDVILSSGAMELLAKHKPLIRQHLISTKVGCKALEDSCSVATFIPFEKRKLHFLKSFSLVKHRLDELQMSNSSTIIIQAHKSFRSTALALYLGYPRITYTESPFSLFAASRVDRITVFHEAQRIALLLEPLGLTREDVLKAYPKLSDFNTPSHTIKESFRALVRNNTKIVAITPGSVWPTKRWPLQHYVSLTKLLLKTPNLGVVLLGGEEEKAYSEQIVNANSGDKVLNLTGQTSLNDLRFIYPKVSCLISNDSSPIHYASSFNISTIAIFGPTVPEMGFSPLADHSVVLEQKGLNCRPCSKHGQKSCPKKHFKCMNDIAVKDVLFACLSILSNTNTAACSQKNLAAKTGNSSIAEQLVLKEIPTAKQTEVHP